MTATEHSDALLEALRRNLHVLNELAVRYEVETDPGRADESPAITSPEDVHRLLGVEMGALCQEQVRVLLLDRRNRVVGQRVIYQGNAYSTVVRPAEVLRPAVVEGVPNLIVAHNHPSGDPSPSPQDISVTKELGQAAKLLGLELIEPHLNFPEVALVRKAVDPLVQLPPLAAGMLGGLHPPTQTIHGGSVPDGDQGDDDGRHRAKNREHGHAESRSRIGPRLTGGSHLPHRPGPSASMLARWGFQVEEPRAPGGASPYAATPRAALKLRRVVRI